MPAARLLSGQESVTVANELCGVETPTGPCTMLKGHTAKFHRHIPRKRFWWEIADETGKVVREGHSRVPMQYALAELLDNHTKLVIKVEVK